jgi:HAD domain in Swiss Army Knife RNA repair proteins
MALPLTDAATNDKFRPGESDSGESFPVVIFLDVDGVLLPFGDTPTTATNSSTTEGSLFPDSCLAAFSTILSAFVDARVVLSSTWRVRKDFRDQILDSLHTFGKKFGGPLETLRLFDITDPSIHSTRQAEIDSWLQVNEYRGAWVALDDEELVYGEENRSRRPTFVEKVVRTRSHTGLTSEDAHQAVSLLYGQLESSSMSTKGDEKQEEAAWQSMAESL